MAAFGDHPFGAHIVRPWPQLKSITLIDYIREAFIPRYSYFRKYDKAADARHCFEHRLVLSSADSCITSLLLEVCTHWDNCWSLCPQPVQRVFKALNTENACPN